MNETIIHISDLHYGLTPRERYNIKALFLGIAKRYPGATVVITGDLTNSATRSQMENMRELIDFLSKTNIILTTPGNHDYAWQGNILRPSGWKNWVELLEGPFDDSMQEIPNQVGGLNVWYNPGIVYLSVDSGDPNDKVISARGYISQDMARGIKDTLDFYSESVRVVFLHHHPFDDGFFTKLHGADRLQEAVSGNCEILLFGHEHKYGLWRNRWNIPMMVASHKSTATFCGDCLVATVLQVSQDNGKIEIDHRLDVIGRV